MTRIIDDVSYSYNRRPENRRIYAGQQIDWFYAELLKAQHGHHCALSRNTNHLWWQRQIARHIRDLSEAHEHHLKACAELGPGKVYVRRHVEDYEYVLRDAAGFIRSTDRGYFTQMDAAMHGHQAAINLGLEVE